MPCVIVWLVIFGCDLLEACSLLKVNKGGLDLGEREDRITGRWIVREKELLECTVEEVHFQ